jgi:serine/threonine protein kinase
MSSDKQRLTSQNISSLPSPVVYAKSRGDALNKGRYRLVGQIPLPTYQQKYGAAWSAVDTQTPSRRRVVIREVIARQGQDVNAQKLTVDAIVQRFITLGQHPGLPKIIDTFNEQGSTYLVFMHVEGESLTLLLSQQGGALSERVVAEYGWALCDILSFFSRQQPPFVHGSINPDTIIINSEGRSISLIHLPLFSSYEAPQNIDKNSPGGYLAPEQIRKHADTSSDLYSVAATLHHAVTGYAPSERVSFFYPPARRLNPTVSQGMGAILSRQLRLSSPQRYATPSEMQKDLLALLESYPDTAEENELPTLFTDPGQLNSAQRREWSRSTNLLNVGVLAAIMVLLIVGILFAVLRF